MAAHAHIPINCMHSHAHTTKQGHRFPCPPKTVTPANRPESNTSAPRNVHTRIPHSAASLGDSLDPALQVLFPLSQLTGLCPGQKLQRGQEQAEAGPRLARAPATPHPGGAHTQGGGLAQTAAGRGVSSGSVQSLRGRLHSRSAGDCPRPRPGLALRSSARPGGAQGRGGS